MYKHIEITHATINWSDSDLYFSYEYHVTDVNQSAVGAAGLGIIRGKKSRTMLNSHCDNNDKKIIN